MQFRSFGLFAGLTLMTNYLLLISFLPAFLVVQANYLNRWLARILPSSLWFLFPSYLPSSSAIPRASAISRSMTHPEERRNSATSPVSIAISRVEERSTFEKLQVRLCYQNHRYQKQNFVFIEVSPITSLRCPPCRFDPGQICVDCIVGVSIYTYASLWSLLC